MERANQGKKSKSNRGKWRFGFLLNRISVDFTVDNYIDFKNNVNNPIVKIYDTFELIQFKNEKSIINIISLSAKDDYKII